LNTIFEPVFVFQQPFLPPEVTAITNQVAVAADHAVAGHNDADAVPPGRRSPGRDGLNITPPLRASTAATSSACFISP